MEYEYKGHIITITEGKNFRGKIRYYWKVNGWATRYHQSSFGSKTKTGAENFAEKYVDDAVNHKSK